MSIYLVNGIKLQGQIESFDQYVVFCGTQWPDGLQACHLDIVPGRPVQFTRRGGEVPPEAILNAGANDGYGEPVAEPFD